jgi:hypothetical protein
MGRFPLFLYPKAGEYLDKAVENFIYDRQRGKM